MKHLTLDELIHVVGGQPGTPNSPDSRMELPRGPVTCKAMPALETENPLLKGKIHSGVCVIQSRPPPRPPIWI